MSVVVAVSPFETYVLDPLTSWVIEVRSIDRVYSQGFLSKTSSYIDFETDKSVLKFGRSSW